MTKKKAAPTPRKTISGAPSNLLDLTLQRIPFAESIDAKMRTLRGRTGITPNILARFGFCLSLEEQGSPQDPFESEGVGREINRNTLLGDNDSVYIALLRTWVAKNDIIETCTQKQFNDFLVAHMNRGFELISSRIRGLPDLASLVGRDFKS
jgi:DNA sulfur modification protein DndE